MSNAPRSEPARRWLTRRRPRPRAPLRVCPRSQYKDFTVLVWNSTVASLTLMELSTLPIIP